ncbi:MAG: ABC transporter ATP-binding protein [Spirochaetaceae bacterium]|nr:ABC transporter ATP-binding protein [Spirochaetaceae bacterium]
MSKLLEVKGLKTHFHMHGYTVRAVDGVDFELGEGETLGVVGESGCGKSQTAMSIMRLVPDPPGRIEAGEVLLRGRDLLKVSEVEMRKVRGDHISMIFQEPMTSLNPVFTVGYQISEVLMLHRDMTKDDALSESARLLDLVGISDPEERVKEYPFQLSGGLRQRVMIAIAMACEPDIMIADEPTTALDVTIQAQILRLMADLKHRTGTSIMFITHDLAVIASFSDRVMVMYAGVAVEHASVHGLFKKPLHPYTQGLLGSIPVLGEVKKDADGTRRLLSAIPGTLPDHRNFPKGCRFAPRCTKVMARCWEVEPALVHTEEGHQVRCFLYSDKVQETAAFQEIKAGQQRRTERRAERKETVRTDRRTGGAS